MNTVDAFTCDVNGDGIYDEETERFYYVTDYYNTSTKLFENYTAVLIYYNNTKNNSVYNGEDTSIFGPITAIKQLPTNLEWKNVSLKNEIRQLYNHDGYIKNTNFSYSGYSSRFLTLQ